MSFDKWTGKQTMVHPYHKKEKNSWYTQKSRWTSGNYAEWKNPILHAILFRLYDILEMIKFRNREHINGCQG